MKILYILLKSKFSVLGWIIGVPIFVFVTIILGMGVKSTFDGPLKDTKTDKETLLQMGECFLWGLIGIPFFWWLLSVFFNAEPR
jgi:hypothetical protein